MLKPKILLNFKRVLSGVCFEINWVWVNLFIDRVEKNLNPDK